MRVSIDHVHAPYDVEFEARYDCYCASSDKTRKANAANAKIVGIQGFQIVGNLVSAAVVLSTQNVRVRREAQIITVRGDCLFIDSNVISNPLVTRNGRRLEKARTNTGRLTVLLFFFLCHEEKERPARFGVA